MEKTENVIAEEALNTNTIIGNEPAYVQYLLELAKWKFGKRTVDISEATGIPTDWISRLKNGIRNSTPSVTDWVQLCDEAGIKMSDLTAMPYFNVKRQLMQFSAWQKGLEGDKQQSVKETLKGLFSDESMSLADVVGYGKISPIKLAQALDVLGMEDKMGFYKTQFGNGEG